MDHTLIIGGFGGQGILFAGQMLAQAVLLEGRAVSWLPSYGPEMRGGTASCTVVIADHAIGSPVADVADSVIALTPPSMAKYEPLLKPGGLLVMNASLIEALPGRDDIETVKLPCTALARLAGDDRLVSVVAIGGLIARRQIVQPDSIRQALVEMLGARRPDLIAADLEALSRGMGEANASPDAALVAPRSQS